MSDHYNGTLAWWALQTTPGLGPKKLAQLAAVLTERRKSASDLLGCTSTDLEAIGIPRRLSERAAGLLSDPPAFPPVPSGVVVITPDDPSYPHHRLDQDLPLPVVLYAMGNVSLLKTPGAGISGSRSASMIALKLASSLSSLLASRGLTIVSGHAAGVDEVAHEAAIRAGGMTTLVIAEGFAQFKPRRSLRGMDSDQALFLSGFTPESRWSTYRAMERNAWIAALSDFMLVVAADEKGGSYAQAQLCLEVGKPLFVVDFPQEVAPGNRQLIRRGARPIDPTNPESIMDDVASLTGASKADQFGLFG